MSQNGSKPIGAEKMKGIYDALKKAGFENYTIVSLTLKPRREPLVATESAQTCTMTPDGHGGWVIQCPH